MSIIYDDQFEDPQFESVRLNGHDAAWDLWIEGEEHGEVITFQNGHTVDQWLAAVAEAAKRSGINLRETLAAVR